MRILVLASVLAALMLGGPAIAQETRTYTDDLGNVVEIPVSPQRIVSMREEQFTAPLVELGAALIGSTGLVNPNINGGQPYARGAYDALDFRFEETGVAWVGNPNQPDFEAVAALEPDLIIIPDFSADNYERLSIIAPVVVLNVWGQDMLDMYRKVADISDRLETFERLHGHYLARIERARETIIDSAGDPATISIAVAQALGTDGMLGINKNFGTLSQVLRDIGFTMPAVIAALEDGNATISVERVEEIDADFMIDTYWTARDQPPSVMIAQWEQKVPAWPNLLHAARHNQVFMVNREEMRAVSFQSLRSITEIVVSQIATRAFVPLGADR